MNVVEIKDFQTAIFYGRATPVDTGFAWSSIKLFSPDPAQDEELYINLGPGEGTPFYGLNRYLQPQRVWFIAVLVISKVSILADFGHFGHI